MTVKQLTNIRLDLETQVKQGKADFGQTCQSLENEIIASQANLKIVTDELEDLKQYVNSLCSLWVVMLYVGGAISLLCYWPSVLLLALCPVVGPLSCCWPSVLLLDYSSVMLLP